MIHGLLPDSMLSVLLVPVIKDKAGKVCSLDNYKPIALASILSKVLEIILLDRLNKFIIFTYNWFDASKTFDHVNHIKLFIKLSQRGTTTNIVRLLAYWYAHQTMQVKWGNSVSASFGLSNGVNLGGILYQILFNLYTDDLYKELKAGNTRCMTGNTQVNHIMYKDDLVVLSPCSAGFQQLLTVCSVHGDIKYNASKSSTMICRTKEDRCLKSNFKLSDNNLGIL